jgi:dihydrofolate reductase
MAELIYAAFTSLDGYVADETGNFDWAELDGEMTQDIGIGGPALAAHAIRAGLVDEYHLLIAPIIAGGGNPYLPGKVSLKLELLDERRFDNGMLHVRYRAKS